MKFFRSKLKYPESLRSAFRLQHKVRYFKCHNIRAGVVVVAVVVVYFILSRLLYLAFSANLCLPCMPHPGMRPLV